MYGGNYYGGNYYGGSNSGGVVAQLIRSAKRIILTTKRWLTSIINTQVIPRIPTPSKTENKVVELTSAKPKHYLTTKKDKTIL